jgi:hypothetical protein
MSVIQFLSAPFVFMYRLYVDGFKSMSRMSKTLWIVAILKLIIMFGFLKVFFFKSELSQYETQEQKIEHISNQLIKVKK